MRTGCLIKVYYRKEVISREILRTIENKNTHTNRLALLTRREERSPGRIQGRKEKMDKGGGQVKRQRNNFSLFAQRKLSLTAFPLSIHTASGCQQVCVCVLHKERFIDKYLMCIWYEIDRQTCKSTHASIKTEVVTHTFSLSLSQLSETCLLQQGDRERQK